MLTAVDCWQSANHKVELVAWDGEKAVTHDAVDHLASALKIRRDSATGTHQGPIAIEASTSTLLPTATAYTYSSLVLIKYNIQVAMRT